MKPTTPDGRTVFIVPWRDRGDPARKRNLEAVAAHLDRSRLGRVWISGDGGVGPAPFNRSRAYNRGVAACPAAEVYVFCEADLLVPAAQLRAGIKLAVQQPGLVIPFSEYRYLSEKSTVAVCSGLTDPFTCTPQRVMADGRSVGACNIVSASTMLAVGSWDEQFCGWGYDDRAMEHAFGVVTGHSTRFVAGPAAHLWHRPGWAVGGRFAGGAHRLTKAEQTATHLNENRWRRYQRATTVNAIRALTAGL